MAYGNDFPNALVQAMANDNNTIIQRVTGGVSSLGMVMMAGGMLLAIPTGGTSLIGVGGGIAMGGMGAEMALSTAEIYSKDVVTSEEQKRYRDMMIMNAGGMIIGAGAGKIGDKVFSKIVDDELIKVFNKAVTSGNRMEFVETIIKTPELVGELAKAGGAKAGTDLLISLFGDLALKYGFDTNEDLENIIRANLIGILMSTGSDVGNLAGRFNSKIPVNVETRVQKDAILPDNKIKAKAEDTAIVDNTKVENEPEIDYETRKNALLEKEPDLKDIINQDNVKLAEKLCADKELPKDGIAFILRDTNKDNLALAEKLCADRELNSFMISGILKYAGKDRIALAEKLFDDKEFPNNEIAYILRDTNKDNLALAEKLCADKEFPKTLIRGILKNTNKDNLAFAEKLCADKEFPKDEIEWILNVTNKDNLSFAEKLCADKEFPKNEIVGILGVTNKDNLALAEKLCADKEFPKSAIKYCLKDTKLCEKLINNPKLKTWYLNNYQNRIEPDTIKELIKTQEKIYNEGSSTHVKATKEKIEKPEEIKSNDVQKAEEILVNAGVHPKMAANFVKKCQENGVINPTKFQAIHKLATAEVSVKDIDNIFKIAVASPLSERNGEFRSEIIDDIVTLKQNGIEDTKLATNIAAVLTMSDAELKARINTKVREDLISRIDNLPEETKTKLLERGIDLNEVKELASFNPNVKRIKKVNAKKVQLRSFDSIVGVEKVVLNKFKQELKPEIWGDETKFKDWAKEKLGKVLDFEQNPNYTATGEYAKFNDARKNGVEAWYKFLKEESNYKDDIFVHLLVMDGITKEFRPNNANTPPAVSHASFEATYNALLATDNKVKFSDAYAQATKARAIEKYSKETVSLNGVEGTWVTIPRSQKGEPDYNDNIAMVQALSEGSSWCLRFESAHDYLQEGNLHFFIDKDGRAQTAIHETDGRISQIQKRYNQDSTTPVPYAEVINEFAKKNNYSCIDIRYVFFINHRIFRGNDRLG